MDFFNTDFLNNNFIKLELEKFTEADAVKKWVPAYHFFICDAHDNRMGKCCLRIGDNENSYFGGHIGYEIDEPYRGHHYAAQACELLFSLAKKHEIPNRIFPHWNGDKMIKLPEKGEEIFLADGQAVYIEDDQCSLL